MGKLPLPEVAGNNQIVPLTTATCCSTSRRITGRAISRAGRPRPARREETALKVTSPVSFDDAEVVRAFATSKDGTQIPVNII